MCTIHIFVKLDPTSVRTGQVRLVRTTDPTALSLSKSSPGTFRQRGLFIKRPSLGAFTPFLSDGKLDDKWIYWNLAHMDGGTIPELSGREGGEATKNISSLLEGTGGGRMNRVVVGKLKLDIDLLEGIKQLAQKEGVQTGIILFTI